MKVSFLSYDIVVKLLLSAVGTCRCIINLNFKSNIPKCFRVSLLYLGPDHETEMLINLKLFLKALNLFEPLKLKKNTVAVVLDVVLINIRKSDCNGHVNSVKAAYKLACSQGFHWRWNTHLCRAIFTILILKTASTQVLMMHYL